MFLTVRTAYSDIDKSANYFHDESKWKLRNNPLPFILQESNSKIFSQRYNFMNNVNVLTAKTATGDKLKNLLKKSENAELKLVTTVELVESLEEIIDVTSNDDLKAYYFDNHTALLPKLLQFSSSIAQVLTSQSVLDKIRDFYAKTEITERIHIFIFKKDIDQKVSKPILEEINKRFQKSLKLDKSTGVLIINQFYLPEFLKLNLEQKISYENEHRNFLINKFDEVTSQHMKLNESISFVNLEIKLTSILERRKPSLSWIPALIGGFFLGCFAIITCAVLSFWFLRKKLFPKL